MCAVLLESTIEARNLKNFTVKYDFYLGIFEKFGFLSVPLGNINSY